MVAEDAGRAAAGLPAPAELEALMTLHRRSHPDAPVGQLTRAFDTAADLHAATHALAVAGVLAGLGMDTTTLVAALLHDTVGNTAYSVDQLRADFGDEVATLVGGVTALGRVKLGRTADAETARKMIVAMARDPRVLVVTLADRLHTMRTVTFLPRPEQERTARETLEILAPLAQRLGLDAIWAELGGLAFGTPFPAEFHEINRLLDEHAPQRHALLQQLIQKAADDLGNAAIRARV